VDADDPIKDVSWPHLKLVYAIALTTLQSSSLDKELADRYITEDFLKQLIKLFESLDSREREMLQSLLYTIYCTMVFKRAFIRQEVRSVMLMSAEGVRSAHGISELLDLMSSVISGFALPIKQEHLDFLFKVLVPLHRPDSMPLYSETLSLCMVQFVERDETLIDDIMSRLLPLWPRVQHSTKHLSFLGQVEEMLSKVHNYDKQNQQWLRLLARKVADCVRSLNAVVSERALLFINGRVFVDFLKPNAASLIPILFPALHEISRSHWCPAVTTLTYKTLLYLMEMNQELFEYLVDVQSTGNELLNFSQSSTGDESFLTMSHSDDKISSGFNVTF